MKTISRFLPLATIVLALALTSASAATYNITFDPGDPIGGLAPGTTLSNQYSSIGVLFSSGTGGATGVVNPTATSQGFATSTDMTVVSIAGGDIGSGVNSPMSGNILHSFNGWLSENGDPVLRINFATPIIGLFSIDFGGIANPASSGIFAINGSNAAIQSAFATTTNTQTVSMVLGTPVSSIVITEGDYGDWVGIDNITFNTVPEPSTWVMLAGGLLLVFVSVRRRLA